MKEVRKPYCMAEFVMSISLTHAKIVTSVLPHGEEQSFKKSPGPRHQSRSLLKPHQVPGHFQSLLLKSRKYLQLAINRVQYVQTDSGMIPNVKKLVFCTCLFVMGMETK